MDTVLPSGTVHEGDLVIAAREVEGEFIAVDRHRDAYPYRLVDRTVPVAGGLAVIRAIGHLRDLGARGALAGAHDLLHAVPDRIGTVLVDQCRDPRFGLGENAVDQLGVHVHLLGIAHVAAYQGPQVLVENPGLDDLQRRQVESLGDDVIGLRAVTSRQESAGVGHVPAELEESKQLAAMEDGANERPVRQVAAAHQVRIVADQQIARREAVPDMSDHVAGGLRGREDVPRDIGGGRDDLAARAQPRQAEIPDQRQHVGLRGVHDLLATVVEQAFELVPDD